MKDNKKVKGNVGQVEKFQAGTSQMSAEEREYLESYDIAMYERPSIAADIAAFSILEEREAANFRKLPEKRLKILLIRRASYPYKDCWALPGGFCQPGEDVCETAKRELYEETSISNACLVPAGIFGEPGRDPRGWIISNTFLALMDGESCKLRADTDAWDAEWFSVKLAKEVLKKEYTKEQADIQTRYTLELVCRKQESRKSDIGVCENKVSGEGYSDNQPSEEIALTAVIVESKQFRDYHETIHYEIQESAGLAFDHAKIILCALLSLREMVEGNPAAIFHFMPERFTLTQLQNAVELVQDRQLLTANFRRKIEGYVVETQALSEGAGHRPAKLFERNVEAFYR